MRYTTRRRYGFLPTRMDCLSATELVGVTAILLFMGLVFHTLAPSVNIFSSHKKIGEVYPPSFDSNESYGVKQACGTYEKTDETVVSQNNAICWIHYYAHRYDQDPELITRIAKAESNLNSKAIGYNTNGTKDVGLLQINDIHNLSMECRLDIHCNLEHAMIMMQSQGTTPWNASKHKWYE
jgi:hypothetical protein